MCFVKMSTVYLTIVCLVIKFFVAFGNLSVDPSLTIVTGPGLQPHLVYPTRYLYIIAVDTSGKNLTESAGAVFKVVISSSNDRKTCRIWTEVLDRHDGSYLVRYRLYETCDGMIIRITYQGFPVAQSPYITKGNVYHEECYCPVSSLHKWQDVMQCPTIYNQVESDLSHFPQIDMNRYVETAIKKFNHPGSQSICNYVVSKNQIYRKCHGQHVGFKMFFDEILLSLTRKVVLPDMELLVNLGDWPLEKKDATKDPIPIFSWCGSKDSYDIVLPTYDLTQSTLESMSRVSLDMMSVQANTGPAWEKKIPKGFWRGRDSRMERLQLVALSRQHPDLLNASLTNFFFFRDLEEKYGPKVNHISFFSFFEVNYMNLPN
ncbi:Protein O-glucosyltransferase 3 [Chamberlinius hualienensis]